MQVTITKKEIETMKKIATFPREKDLVNSLEKELRNGHDVMLNVTSVYELGLLNHICQESIWRKETTLLLLYFSIVNNLVSLYGIFEEK